MSATLRIGIDLDNTIVIYDDLFRALAREAGYVAADEQTSKVDIRLRIIEREGDDIPWQRFQAAAYGKRIGEAEIAEGFEEFVLHCREIGHDVTIVSHKSQYSLLGEDQTDLRRTALELLHDRGFFGKLGFSGADIFFETTRAEKIKRIESLGCGVFIDDLPEVLLDPAFPPTIDKILFARSEDHEALQLPRAKDWYELRELFDRRH